MKVVFEEPGVYIVDDFLEDPDSSRQHALSSEFPLVGPFPGFRTRSPAPEWGDVNKHKFEEILGRPIRQWPKRESPNGGAGNTLFHVAFASAKPSIHWDNGEWSAVLYLTPNPPADSGTTIWVDEHTNTYKYDDFIAAGNTNIAQGKWKPLKVLEPKYNRLVLYPANFIHCATRAGFGNTMETARLTQVYFFATEKDQWIEKVS